jgi:hypothetical protein
MSSPLTAKSCHAINTVMNNNEILIQVVEKAGGWRALGRGLKINYQAIQSWKRIPAERVIAIEQITGISRKHLRPDLYGPKLEKLKTQDEEIKHLKAEIEKLHTALKNIADDPRVPPDLQILVHGKANKAHET